MIVVLNKIDLLPEENRAEILLKKLEALKKIFSKTKFGSKIPMVCISANKGAKRK